MKIGAVASGLKKPDELDLLVVALSYNSNLAAVFTRNHFRAAPVILASENMGKDTPRALIFNTGVANAGTGVKGLNDARRVCAVLATQLGIRSSQVLPFSTGVIMERLPVHKIINSLPMCIQKIKEDNWRRAAKTIMTTDTVSKGSSKQINLGGKLVTFTGIAKGSGMIEPNMATMLSLMATDIDISPVVLNKIIQEVTQTTFNCISVDGDTSTNDSFVLVATGRSSAPKLSSHNDPHYSVVFEAIREIATKLAKKIVQDGEGATKLVTIRVVNSRDKVEAREVAIAVAQSPLVKTAFFAEDPNLGRILAAIGKANVDEINLQSISISIDNLKVFENGAVSEQYNEDKASEIMKKAEIVLSIDLDQGVETIDFWTCDFSYDYVRINSDYRS